MIVNVAQEVDPTVAEKTLGQLGADLFEFRSVYPGAGAALNRMSIELSSCPTMHVRFHRDHIRLGVNPEFYAQLSFEDACFGFLHEIEHVCCGHLLRAVQNDRWTKLDNAITDTLINERLARTYSEFAGVIQAGQLGPIKIWTWRGLYDLYHAHANFVGLAKDQRWDMPLIEALIADWTYEDIFDMFPKMQIRRSSGGSDPDDQEDQSEGSGGSGASGSSGPAGTGSVSPDQDYEDGDHIVREIESTDDESIVKEVVRKISEEVREAEKEAGVQQYARSRDEIRLHDRRNRNWIGLIHAFGSSIKMSNHSSRSYSKLDRKVPVIRPGVVRQHLGRGLLVFDRSGSIIGNKSIREQLAREIFPIQDEIDIDLALVHSSFDPDKDLVENFEIRSGDSFDYGGETGGTMFDDLYDWVLDKRKNVYGAAMILTDGWITSRSKRYKHGVCPGLASQVFAIVTGEHNEEFIEEARRQGWKIAFLSDHKEAR